MIFTQLTIETGITPQQFVEFWASFYDRSEDDLYNKAIFKEQFTREDIEQLFLWKNGGIKLSRFKKQVVDKICSHLDIVNRLKRNGDWNTFKEFEDIGVIWRIFLQHIIAPAQYPICDQHVLRAFKYIKTAKVCEIQKVAIERTYLDEYVPFFNGIVKLSGSELKKVDEALMMFGKFLSSPFGKEMY